MYLFIYTYIYIYIVYATWVYFGIIRDTVQHKFLINIYIIYDYICIPLVLKCIEYNKFLSIHTYIRKYDADTIPVALRPLLW